VIGTRLGPYRLEKELGAGGMGAVWLATALEDATGVKAGAKVALKIVHPHLLERSGFFKRFMREAEIGRSVRHESVVRTFDVDALSVDGKQINFMVMEYVEGKTLRALLDELKTVPETLLREIARQVASGLAAIHAAGIVHRDLKPENVLITPDHVVKVMDLGVARLMEESVALTREGSFAGSLLYAAPEQFGGKAVGPAVDLYSVGVMLYELASGENPFQRDGAGAVMAAHMKEVPPRLSDRNSEVSPFFSEVVRTLLSKDPEERFDSSKAFLELIEQGERSTWWGDRERVILKEEGHLPKIPVRRETALHGRDESLALLSDAWKSAKSGRGQMVLLEGEAGIGKSRLVDAFLSTLKGEDAHVLYGSYPPSGGQGGLTDALIAKFGTAAMAEALAPYLTVTPRLVPAFCALIQHDSPPPGSEPLSSDGFHAVFVHLMKALAAEKPLLWIVDDLQFAQPDSRKVVLSLARALEGQRVLLLCAARPGIPEDEMAHFSRLPTFKKAGLARLGARDVIALLKDALKSGVLAERLGGKIAFKSDGVPYFVFEMIRGLKEGNFIRQEADGTYVETRVVSDIEVPSSVRDLIEARLKDLTDEDRNLLNVASVQGIEFDPRLVAMVCEVKTMKALERISAVERRSGVVRAAGKTWRFDQNQIQEILYRSIPESLRDEYHAALADAFAEREGVAGKAPKDVPGPAAVFLAEHHLRGSRPREAVPIVVPAAEHLSKAYRDEEALDLLERALAASGPLAGPDRMEALLLVGPLRRDHGRPADGTAALEEAVALADATGEALSRARARRALGGHLSSLGLFAPALEITEAALLLAREAGGAKEERALEHIAVSCLWRLGRLLDARERCERSLALAREAGDVADEVGGTGALGALLSELGHYSESRAHKKRALELHRNAGDRRGESRQTGNLGEDDRADGDYVAAESRYRASVVLARETGYRNHEGVSHHNLGETLTTLGDLDGARQSLESAATLSREIGARWLFGYACRASADRALATGDATAAAALYAEALNTAREVKFAAAEAESLVGLGRLHARAGRIEEAAARLGEALETARRMDEPNSFALAAAIRAALPGGDPAAAAKTLDDLGTRPWHVARMEARFWLWKATQDRAHLAESWRLLVHLRDHAPEENKVTVMENVPLHREIAAAAKAAGL
jgi:tetratricopeptide (TPR) repeat protein